MLEGAIVEFLSFPWICRGWLWPFPEAACVPRGGTALLEETECTSKLSAIYLILANLIWVYSLEDLLIIFLNLEKVALCFVEFQKL